MTLVRSSTAVADPDTVRETARLHALGKAMRITEAIDVMLAAAAGPAHRNDLLDLRLLSRRFEQILEEVKL